ncbi:MAG: zinc-dependent metalloprotease [Chitinophaga sp.]|uniref:M43 family zinc metalloprotease n=1 Tax=Chitinophaga sp. TaxID=1869181 RepID=UPI0025BBD378|nr:M43 family zinc metalloprotease [Chitinophaga sp.]MBV8251399.1 zinc-dependent metalloprotease [Chitinophaga sp.]
MSQLSKKIIGALLCLLIAFQAMAQQTTPLPPLADHCTASKAMLELYKKQPAAKKRAEKMEAFTRSFIANARQMRAAAQTTQPVQYTIPVVFHINDPVNPYKVTMEQIRSAIAILNQDYNLLNQDYSQIDPRFIGLAANLHITFKLADIDPNGNPTTGVTYHINDLDGRSPDGSGSAVKSISYWPGEKYLNIWIVSEVEQKGVYNNSGWTYLPDDGVAAAHVDGVVYNWRYLGAPGIGSSENGYPNMKRVLTHEVGHFLNLWHTFENGCNAPGDYVDDTPPTQSNYGGCNLNANWCGVVANVENYMDYSSCVKMFTLGQKDRMMAALNSTVASRSNLWSNTNLTATLIPDSIKRIIPTYVTFLESDTNNGSITLMDTLRLAGGAKFTMSSGNMVQGTHFSIQNLPTGLSTVIQLVNDSTAVLSFSGNATQNNAVNSTDSVRLTFLSAAIQGGTGILNRANLLLGIHFIDPYKIIFGSLSNTVINAANTWNYFTFNNTGDASYGGWYDGGKLRLETYQKYAVCDSGSLNISPLPVNTVISTTSGFVPGGAYPNEHNIWTTSFTKWAGQTAYAGIQFTINGKPRYGWIRMNVSADGSTLTLKDYAYSQTPYGSIKAGDPGGTLPILSKTTVREALANDGSISDTVNIDLLGNTFAISSGDFSNSQYNVSSLPAGLSVKITALSNSTARLTFTGKAANNAVANNTNITINFLAAAFSARPDTASQQLAISFRDPYTIKYIKVDTTAFTVNASNNWYYFLVDNNNDAAYGLWIDSARLRLETYSKPMVCVPSTKNISLLPLNTNISDTSSFVAGGAYPNEHMLSTSTYTPWNGQTGYAGFNFTSLGDTYYGWFRFKVQPNGTGYTLIDYAYNTKPSTAIKAGQQTLPSDTTVVPSNYCTASTLLNYNSITRVRLANLDNSSGWTSYSDFTALTANVTKGQAYTLTVNLGIEYWPDISVAVWIDWNGDKRFNDTTEKVYVKRGAGPFTQSITVPANAITGTTMMRVRMGYGQNMVPCGVDTYQGEVEDYSIKISNGTATLAAIANNNTITATSPFTDRININYQSTVEGPVVVRLYDLRGNLVRRLVTNVNKGANVIQLHDLGGLLPGMYVVNIANKEKHDEVKVIK